jgi:hypothetical protein
MAEGSESDAGEAVREVLASEHTNLLRESTVFSTCQG